MSKVIYYPMGRVKRNQSYYLELPASAEIVQTDIRPIYKGFWFWRKAIRFELDVFAVVHDGSFPQRRTIRITNVGDGTAGYPFAYGTRGKWLGRFDLISTTHHAFDFYDVWEMEAREEINPDIPELEAA